MCETQRFITFGTPGILRSLRYVFKFVQMEHENCKGFKVHLHCKLS